MSDLQNSTHEHLYEEFRKNQIEKNGARSVSKLRQKYKREYISNKSSTILLTEESRIVTVWYDQKMSFFNPKFEQIYPKIVKFRHFSDSEIPKNFSTFYG